MRRALGWVLIALAVLACIAYQYLVHVSVGSAQVGVFHPLLIWFPLVALAVWVLACAGNKPLWLAAIGAAAVFVLLAEHQERMGLAAVSGISHATAYLFLLWYFGRTLARGRVPLITRLARRVQGALQPEFERFTRNLTIAWCVFSGAQLMASALLYALAPLELWSAFVNLLNLPLLGLMFAGQWVYRDVRHPEFPRATIRQAIEAFIQDASLSSGEGVR
jgi:uncharacterized membrane protein